MRLLLMLVVSLVCAAQAGFARAAEPRVERLLGKLKSPFGLAIQPDTGAVFVAESGGGRLVRVVDGKAEEVIRGFPLGAIDRGAEFRVGPLALGFLPGSINLLAVGCGGAENGEDQLAVFDVGSGEWPLASTTSKLEMRLTPSNTLPAAGEFTAILVAEPGVYVATRSEDDKAGSLVPNSRTANSSRLSVFFPPRRQLASGVPPR